MSPTKFRFTIQDTNFFGYNIGCTSYRLSDEMSTAIRDFPMPSNPNSSISDIQSWFRLVNQFAPIIASASFMEPFYELFQQTNAKDKKIFQDNQLKEFFKKPKILVTKHAEKGLTYYDTRERRSYSLIGHDKLLVLPFYRSNVHAYSQ